MLSFGWGKKNRSLSNPNREDNDAAKRFPRAKHTPDGLPAECRNLGQKAREPLDSDDSETDAYGFAHKRKKSEPSAPGHTRIGSQESKQRSCQCPTCNEVCLFDLSDDLVPCLTCDTKVFPPAGDEKDKRPLPPIPVQQPMSLKEFEFMMVDLYRQYGRIVFRHEKASQEASQSTLEEPFTVQQFRHAEATNGLYPAGKEAIGISQTANPPQSPPQLRHPNGHSENRTPISQQAMLRPSRPPNLVFRDRAATSQGHGPTTPSPRTPRTPRTPLTDARWRKDVEKDLEEAKFKPMQIERLVEASAMVLPIKDKIRSIFGNSNCLNQTFCSTRRPVMTSRSKSENALDSPRRDKFGYKESKAALGQMPLPPLPPTPQQLFQDHKTLMIGEVYDVVRPLADAIDKPTVKSRPSKSEKDRRSTLAYTDWEALRNWYITILNYCMDVDRCMKAVCENNENRVIAGPLRDEVRWIGMDIMRTLLEQIDQVVTAPRHSPSTAHELRYLIVLLVNPIFGPKHSNLGEAEYRKRDRMKTVNAQPYKIKQGPHRHGSDSRKDIESPRQRLLGVILGRLANAPREHQQTLIYWFAEVPGRDFRNLVETLKRFIGERLRLMKPRSKEERDAIRSQRNIFNSINLPSMVPPRPTIPRYSKSKTMWQLRAACQVLQMLFIANDRHVEKPEWWERIDDKMIRHSAVRNRLLPVDEFSFSLLDPSAGRIDVEEDFEAWETRAAKFTFCQYRFMLTLGTKVKIMEMYCNRKRKEAARQDWYSSSASNRDRDGYFRIKVRRDCVADDSLKQLKEAIGSGSGETMKKLRVMFEDEMAIDGGGPQKEWFLSLAQDLFHGDHALFFFNPDSNYCYFNPFFYESTEVFELVGALFGLAVYNQTSLYAPFPPFLFKKLAAAASTYSPKLTSEPSAWRSTWRPSLEDLAQLDPHRAAFLRNLLNEQEEFESFSWEYPLIKYDIIEVTPICPGGSEKLVNKENREEYVQTAVQFAIDTSIEKQFGAFARGFYLLCGGNALSLFRGEELELLLRGSDDFDVDTLRASATYDGWDDLTTEEKVSEKFPIVGFFWDFFASSSLAQRQRILRFITGTDRLPPAGVANLVICIARLKVNCVHLPQSRTCFNQLQLPDSPVETSEFETLFLRALEYGSDSFGRK